MLSHFDVGLPSSSDHVEPFLLDLVVGAWQPTPSEENYLIDHLIECMHCKIVLAAFVLHMEDEPTDVAQDILALLAKTIHGKSTWHKKL